MRQIEIYTRTVEDSRIIKVLCDRCGSELPKPRHHCTRELQITFATGFSYPDSISKQGWQVEDLCDDCVSWLRSLLEANGVKVVPYAVDW